MQIDGVGTWIPFQGKSDLCLWFLILQMIAIPKAACVNGFPRVVWDANKVLKILFFKYKITRTF